MNFNEERVQQHKQTALRNFFEQTLKARMEDVDCESEGRTRPWHAAHAPLPAINRHLLPVKLESDLHIPDTTRMHDHQVHLTHSIFTQCAASNTLPLVLCKQVCVTRHTSHVVNSVTACARFQTYQGDFFCAV